MYFIQQFDRQLHHSFNLKPGSSLLCENQINGIEKNTTNRTSNRDPNINILLNTEIIKINIGVKPLGIINIYLNKHGDIKQDFNKITETTKSQKVDHVTLLIAVNTDVYPVVKYEAFACVNWNSHKEIAFLNKYRASQVYGVDPKVWTGGDC